MDISHPEEENSGCPMKAVAGEEEDGIANGVDYKEWNGVDIMESLCMSCGATGETRLMLHKIPYFRELVIASFACEECGERNNEVTFGGEIQVQGSVYELKVTRAKDLDRQIIKSDSAALKIKEIEFEIPPKTQKGEITTIEGVLRVAAKNLSHMQPLRMIETPEIAKKVQEIIDSLTEMADGERLPFTISLDDPAGNSFIENPFVPQLDPELKMRYYFRTPDQDIALGLDPATGVFKDDKDGNLHSLITGEKTFGGVIKSDPSPPTMMDESESGEEEHVRLGRSEAVAIPATCPSCSQIGESLTALTDIPHFKEVIIMAFDCKFCGFRTNEVKGGGAVPTFGTEVRLTVTSEEDLKRDLLKSDSAMLSIPELELDLQHGTLGGVFTTVEGMLNKIRQSLFDSNPFAVGDSTVKHHSEDSSISSTKNRFTQFLDELGQYAAGKVFPFTLIIRDPLGNSFISAPLGTFLPPEADVNLQVVDFERSFEENEEFGLNDMNTRDYETGVPEELEQGPILPDRLTHQCPKGADHPTPFAKGMTENDNTPLGFTNGNLRSSSADNPSTTLGEEHYYQPPAGWSVEKVNGGTSGNTEVDQSDSSVAALSNKRHIDDDSDLDFIQYEEFSGRKDGYVFRLGSKGIGYYADRRKKLAQEP